MAHKYDPHAVRTYRCRVKFLRDDCDDDWDDFDVMDHDERDALEAKYVTYTVAEWKCRAVERDVVLRHVIADMLAKMPGWGRPVASVPARQVEVSDGA